MNSFLVSTPASSLPHISTTTKTFNLLRQQPTFRNFLSIPSKFITPKFISSSNGSNNLSDESFLQNDTFQTELTNPQLPSFNSPLPNFTFSDQAFFLLAFIACTVWSFTLVFWVYEQSGHWIISSLLHYLVLVKLVDFFKLWTLHKKQLWMEYEFA